jgi:uncharacterized protein with NRDE domain
VLAANRDELLARPAAPLAAWRDAPAVVGGRDLEKGGTWLALRRDGRIALVTNYRDLRKPNPAAGDVRPSRGDLVATFVRGDERPSAFLSRIGADDPRYEPYNLVVGDVASLVWHSNVTRETRAVERGVVHGVSNALLDTPWPKVVTLKATLARLLETRSNADANMQNTPNWLERELLEALASTKRAPAASLPDTGAGPELEAALSAPFVRLPGYGTRCSSIITVDASRRVRFVERTYDARGLEAGTRIEQFRLGE